MSYKHIINEAFNRPVILEPGYAGFFYAYLCSRVGAESLRIDDEILDKAAMQHKAGLYDGEDSRESKRSYQVVDGVAVIPVMGTLMHRFGFLESMSGGTSYDSLKTQVLEAENDPAVEGVFYLIDSPGGAVAGAFDFCDFIRSTDKPSAAVVDELSASGGFAIASQIDQVYLPRTGKVGSVGVVWAHQHKEDSSVTLVHSGANKVDRNPYEPLPESVRASVQSELDEMRQIFAQTVASGRGISVESVLGTEAQMYMGQHAVDVGFADAVMSKDQAFQTFKNSLSSGSIISTGVSMTDQTGSVSASTETTSSASSTEQVPAVVNTVTPEQATAQADAAVAAEQSRIFSIIEHASAQGRMASAIKMAKSGMSVDAAAEVLDTIPMASQQSPQAAASAQALQAMASAEIVEPEVTSTEQAEVKPALFIV